MLACLLDRKSKLKALSAYFQQSRKKTHSRIHISSRVDSMLSSRDRSLTRLPKQAAHPIQELFVRGQREHVGHFLTGHVDPSKPTGQLRVGWKGSDFRSIGLQSKGLLC